jgi:DNA polymerase III alpha subunit
MRTDNYGQLILNETDLCDLFLRDPTRIIKQAFVEQEINLDQVFISTENLPKLSKYQQLDMSVNQFDDENQEKWFMPKEYLEMDIAQFVLSQCANEAELQRAGDELFKFQEKDLFNLLRYLKFLVDTMRKNNVVWGVGRGSSVASFVLFLLGVHRINSLYYDLSIDEFLK